MLNHISLLSHNLVSFSHLIGAPGMVICHTGHQCPYTIWCVCLASLVGYRPWKQRDLITSYPFLFSFLPNYVALSEKKKKKERNRCQKKSEIRLWEFKRVIQVHTITSDGMGIWTQLLHTSSFHPGMFPVHSLALPKDTGHFRRAETVTVSAQEIRYVILVKWLFWLLWNYRTMSFPLGLNVGACVCAHVHVCICVYFNYTENKIKQIWEGAGSTIRKQDTNTCSRYKPSTTQCPKPTLFSTSPETIE